MHSLCFGTDITILFLKRLLSWLNSGRKSAPFQVDDRVLKTVFYALCVLVGHSMFHVRLCINCVSGCVCVSLYLYLSARLRSIFNGLVGLARLAIVKHSTYTIYWPACTHPIEYYSKVKSSGRMNWMTQRINNKVGWREYSTRMRWI